MSSAFPGGLRQERERLAVLALPHHDELRVGKLRQHLGERGEGDREPLLRVQAIHPQDPTPLRQAFQGLRLGEGADVDPVRDDLERRLGQRTAEERRRRLRDGDAEGHSPPDPAEDGSGELHHHRTVEIGVDRRHDGCLRGERREHRRARRERLVDVHDVRTQRIQRSPGPPVAKVGRSERRCPDRRTATACPPSAPTAPRVERGWARGPSRRARVRADAPPGS